MAEFVMTLDDDGPLADEESDEEVARAEEIKVNPNFRFDVAADPVRGWGLSSAKELVSDPMAGFTTSVDEKVAKIKFMKQKLNERQEVNRRRAAGETDAAMAAVAPKAVASVEEDMDAGEDEDEGDQESDAPDGDDAEAEAEADEASGAGLDHAGMTDEDREELRRQKEFFTEASEKDVVDSFAAMNLSRPLLKAVRALEYQRPTPIQARTIPVVLAGHDLCGSAVTGSGKTASFVLPILERLLYRPKRVPVSRVLILLPTRELAVQCAEVVKELAKFTDITVTLVAGGLSQKQQETELRARPDIIVATPGRLIDHVKNTPSFGLSEVEILVLDEADRLLDIGFTDELKEIVQACPRGRQTLLFSATMTSKVDELAALSLNKPVRVSVDPTFNLADNLVQEFVRIRQAKEEDREAILMALVDRTYKKETLIFFPSKFQAHRAKVIFSLANLNAAELHGNLTQAQRLEAVEQFRSGSVNFLLCTDLASRGLDIKDVKTVINFSMPNEVKAYVHRVGRTARAGMGGRAVTLVGERDRRVLKEVIKHSKRKAQRRVIADNAVDAWRQKIEEMETDIKELMREEELEKSMRIAEMEANRAKNMIVHEDEIHARPAKSWFQAKDDKANAKKASLMAHLGEAGYAELQARLEAGKKRKREDGGEDEDGEPKKKKVKRDKHAGLSRMQKRRKKFADLAAKQEKMEEREGKPSEDKPNQKLSVKAAKKSDRKKQIERLESGEDRIQGGPSKRAGRFERQRSKKRAEAKDARDAGDAGDGKPSEKGGKSEKGGAGGKSPAPSKKDGDSRKESAKGKEGGKEGGSKKGYDDLLTNVGRSNVKELQKKGAKQFGGKKAKAPTTGGRKSFKSTKRYKRRK